MNRLLLTHVLVLLFGLVPGQHASAAAALSVDMDTAIQNDFLGVNAIYHGFAFMPEQTNKGMNDTDRAREFDRVQRIRLNIARTWYHPNFACTKSSGLSGAYNWNSTRMNALYSWLQAMQDRHVDVALQLGWWFTQDTYYGHSSPDPTNDPPKFAAWASESLHQIIEVKGFTNVKYGILFTEPTAYDTGGKIPTNYTQWSYYVKVVKAVHDKLVADGRRNLVKLVGPNNTFAGYILTDLTNAVNELNDQIDIYSGHDYNRDDYFWWAYTCNNLKGTVSATGKQVWLDEWGMQDEAYRQTPDYGNYVAQGVAACLNSGLQTCLSWTLFDQQYISADSSFINNWTSLDSFYNGVQRWGFTKWPHDTIANPTLPYPSWYAFSLMSKYLGGRGGTRVFQTTNDGGVYISAVQQPAGDWSFLVVNTNGYATNIQVNLSQPLNRAMCRYLYDPNQIVPTAGAAIIGADQLSNVGTSFTDSLPARGVAIYSTIGPVLSVAPGSNDTVILSWSDPDFHLQSAGDVSGSYTNEPNGAVSPVTNTVSGANKFYRLSD
jgi:hypothetical protein